MNARRLVALLPLIGALALGQALAQEPAPAPASGAAAAVEDPERAQSELNREIRTVEQDVNGLKERVFRSKATLQLLRELVMEGSSLGSRLVVWHVNKMGPAYTLESVQYFLDSKNIYNKLDETGGLDKDREFQVLEQAVPPGTHNLQVSLVLRGNGLGVFSYLKSYSFRVQSSYSIDVKEGRETTVKVIANEKGGPWRTFVDRPNVDYEATDNRVNPEAQ
jgi:hypothetical protein